MGKYRLVDSKFGAQRLAASSLRDHISAAGRRLAQATDQRWLSLLQALDLVGRRSRTSQTRPGFCRRMLKRLSSRDYWCVVPAELRVRSEASAAWPSVLARFVQRAPARRARGHG